MLPFSDCNRNLAVAALLHCSIVALQANGDDATMAAIRDQYSLRREQLHQVDVKWSKNVRVLTRIAGEFVDSKCRAALKGEKRFYDIQYTSAAGARNANGTRREAMSYDGHETRILTHSRIARIWPGDRRGEFDAPDDFLALQGYPQDGYRIRWSGGNLSTDVVALLAQSNYKASRKTTAEGTNVVEIAGPGDRILMDPSRGYAIVQRDVFDGKGSEPLFRYSFEDFIEVMPGFWLANRIVCEAFAGSVVEVRSELRVSNITLDDIPDDLFVLQFEPGTSVADVRHFPPDSDGSIPIVGYKIPASPEDLDKVVAAAVKRNQELWSDGSRTRSLQRALIAINVLIIILVAILLIRRRAKAS